jgi:L-lactate dehydrogenase complex protein LldF
MSARTRVESFSRRLDSGTVDSVRSASVSKTTARSRVLPDVFANHELAQQEAASRKAYVLDHLRELLIQLESNCIENGIHVHWALDAKEANAIIIELCMKAKPKDGLIVKAKSMATEEIHLNTHLEEAGFKPIETDLGEFVAQIDHDLPSHIVTPIIHKNRRQIAASFERNQLGDYTEVPEELAMQAREHLRSKFRDAEIGISGVNFAIAETGAIVLVENEGNNRLSTTSPRVHIALMGIEKVLPEMQDLSLFLPLLSSSATGQRFTTYTHFIRTPRRGDERDGPDEVHLILLDNNRTSVLNGPYRDILKCIRCGACLNVCPVYRQSSGHAYDHVYSGPLGAVLAPALEGLEKMGDLSKASTLCGACEEVCPVKIPIPAMLLKLRSECNEKGLSKERIPWKGFSWIATHPGIWKAGLTFLPMAKIAPHSSRKDWEEYHDLPKKQGKDFRRWWNDR